ATPSRLGDSPDDLCHALESQDLLFIHRLDPASTAAIDTGPGEAINYPRQGFANQPSPRDSRGPQSQFFHYGNSEFVETDTIATDRAATHDHYDGPAGFKRFVK